MSQPGLCQRFGEHHDLQVLLFEPLFEEANRTRRLIAQMARGLDAAGIGLIIACLSGTGESDVGTDHITLAGWQADAATLAAHFRPTVIASLRGGALIDSAALAGGYWRFSPESGARIVRDLRRTQAAGDSDLFAGNRLSEGFVAELEAAGLAPVSLLRIVRLESEAAEADAKVVGSPLWRRAEPGEDTALAQALAADLAAWVQTCAAS